MNKFIGVGVIGIIDEIDRGIKLRVAVTLKRGVQHWFSVYCFDEIADNCRKYKKIGDRVFVDGRLDVNENGDLHVIASSIGFL